ncbi:MAG: PDDEXK nuclease domain-containing protein [Planctomycetota bacterium]|jgi:predicted nuclease of restriction endonuclease-like (RecB) superfamily|nr:PDDEXK nuclease domain-containing protein [Planctomycetota bacterium]
MKSKDKGKVPGNSESFAEVATIIKRSRENAFRAVNRELISLYWEIGRYISEKTETSGWGKAVVTGFADYLQAQYAGSKGFSPQNIWRMKQFYATYRGNEKLSPLVREISWTNNLLIMMAAKTDEEREFYLLLSRKNKYSKRELARQIDSSLFEQTLISNTENQPFAKRDNGLTALRDSYVLEFLDIPERHKEKEMRKAIIANLRDFILEFGKDFSFLGDEYKVQVGNTDFKLDLLFYNRVLSCLVAIELKIGRFKPEHLGQLEFYLEALDRDVRKSNENPSVGLILCSQKDTEVVEYALSRSMSPALIAEYQTHLPQKALLENKLRELRDLAEAEELRDADESGDGE